MILVKKWHFLHFLFWGKIHLEIMFGDLFDTKESFLAFKDLHFRLLHFFIFSKRVNP